MLWKNVKTSSRQKEMTLTATHSTQREYKTERTHQNTSLAFFVQCKERELTARGRLAAVRAENKARLADARCTWHAARVDIYTETFRLAF